ncbi:MAG: hypothetical protein UU98_C0002G0041 [Parcubacteria group bacterium GW2011_GWD2_42_14]|nr:MAG: hypothetical protein UU98_C0002G0041 [Parcubacteria group bacterium GW2011_GWD2_42_14]
MKETFPALSKFAEDDLVKGEREKIAKNPDLRTLYSDIIEQNNFDRLREKSELQLYNLKTRYFGDLHPEDNEFAQKEEKIREFTQFVENLIPVRVDPNEYDEYISPERSGNIKSFGPQDILVRSDQFVYGSFAEIGHLMSQGRNQRLLDIDDIAPRAQIVMQDIANIVARVGGDQSAVEKYLLNLFDWENGKKILAFYLASVFDTTQQAMDALSGTGGNPQIAQRYAKTATQNELLFLHNVRVGRIELPNHPWQGRIIPLNHTRGSRIVIYHNFHSTKSPLSRNMCTFRYFQRYELYNFKLLVHFSLFSLLALLVTYLAK